MLIVILILTLFQTQGSTYLNDAVSLDDVDMNVGLNASEQEDISERVIVRELDMDNVSITTTTITMTTATSTTFSTLKCWQGSYRKNDTGECLRKERMPSIPSGWEGCGWWAITMNHS